jgi:hypothetical protein
MNILVVGGDSIEAFQQPSTNGARCVEHWTGRKRRDLVRSIPKATDAVVVVLDRVSHRLADRVRREASRRGLPVYFLKRRQQKDMCSRSNSCFDAINIENVLLSANG